MPLQDTHLHIPGPGLWPGLLQHASRHAARSAHSHEYLLCYPHGGDAATLCIHQPVHKRQEDLPGG